MITSTTAAATDVAVMTRRGLVLMGRSPAALASAAAMPIILLVLLSVSFGRMIMPGVPLADYVQYATPLFATMGVVFGSLTTAVAAHQDRVSGFDDRLRTLPISAAAPLAGRIVADIVRNLIVLALVTIVAMAMGFRFQNGFAGALLYVVLPLLLGFGVAWLMVAVAMAASSAESAVSILNALLLVASFFSTGLVTKDDLPGWAQVVAEINPISHIVAAMRDATTSGAPVFGADALITIAWAIGLTAVFGVLGVLSYQRRD